MKEPPCIVSQLDPKRALERVEEAGHCEREKLSARFAEHPDARRKVFPVPRAPLGAKKKHLDKKTSCHSPIDLAFFFFSPRHCQLEVHRRRRKDPHIPRGSLHRDMAVSLFEPVHDLHQLVCLLPKPDAKHHRGGLFRSATHFEWLCVVKLTYDLQNASQGPLEGRSLVGAFEGNDLQQYLQTSRPPIVQGTLHLKYNSTCLIFVSARGSHPRCKYDAASRYRNGIRPAGKVRQSSTRKALYLVNDLQNASYAPKNSKFENHCFLIVFGHPVFDGFSLPGQLHGPLRCPQKAHFRHSF